MDKNTKLYLEDGTCIGTLGDIIELVKKVIDDMAKSIREKKQDETL